MKIGCHISVAKGFHHAAERAVELGAQSFQVFTKNPRALRTKKLNVEDVAKGRAICDKHEIIVVAHTPYITNLSTPKEDLQALTIRSIKEDLQIASAYGAVGAVVHCGKHVGEGVDYGLKRMVETLNMILRDYEGDTKLLLENTAGQGTELGLTLSELVLIRESTDYPEKIGICFDTCHGFASGAWCESDFSTFVVEMKESGYIQNLKAIHFNDSKVPYNSRKDRHQKIGLGEIGTEALNLFLQEPAFDGLPVVLETPVEHEDEYAAEIQMLHQRRSLA